MTNGEIIRMRKAGFTYQEIANKAGIPWGTVRSRCRAWGIKPEVKVIHQRKPSIKNNYPKWLIEMMYWECELSTVDIAFELCISPNSVKTMMDRLAIPCRTKAQAHALYKKRYPLMAKPPYSVEQQRKATKISAEKRAKRKKYNEQRQRRRQKAKVCN